MFCSFLVSLILGPYAIHIYNGKDRTKWQPNEAGYTLHMIAAFAEWTTMLCLNFFLLTYTREMRKIHVRSPRVFVHIDKLLSTNQTENNSFNNENDAYVEVRTDGVNQNIIG